MRARDVHPLMHLWPMQMLRMSPEFHDMPQERREAIVKASQRRGRNVRKELRRKMRAL